MFIIPPPSGKMLKKEAFFLEISYLSDKTIFWIVSHPHSFSVFLKLVLECRTCDRWIKNQNSFRPDVGRTGALSLTGDNTETLPHIGDMPGLWPDNKNLASRAHGGMGLSFLSSHISANLSSSRELTLTRSLSPDSWVTPVAANMWGTSAPKSSFKKQRHSREKRDGSS